MTGTDASPHAAVRYRPSPLRAVATLGSLGATGRGGSGMAEAAAPAPNASVSFMDMARAAIDWLKRNWLRTLIVSVISFGLAWLWNMWLMAYRLQGHRVDSGRGSTTATADGKSYNMIYWLLVTTVLFSIISYGHERGYRTMLQEVVSAPKRIMHSFHENPNVTAGMFLWGMSLSLVVAVVLTQAMSGILALGFIIAAPSFVANILNNFFIRVWRIMLGNFAPQVKEEAGAAASPLTVMLGQGFGMIIAFLFGNFILKLLLAIVCGVLSYVVVVVTSKPKPTPAAVIIVVGAALGLVLVFLHPGRAFADDGGWQECHYNGHQCSHGLFGFWQWFRSHGANIVIKRSFIGGFGGGLGAILGATLG